MSTGQGFAAGGRGASGFLRGVRAPRGISLHRVGMRTRVPGARTACPEQKERGGPGGIVRSMAPLVIRVRGPGSIHSLRHQDRAGMPQSAPPPMMAPAGPRSTQVSRRAPPHTDPAH